MFKVKGEVEEATKGVPFGREDPMAGMKAAFVIAPATSLPSRDCKGREDFAKGPREAASGLAVVVSAVLARVSDGNGGAEYKGDTAAVLVVGLPPDAEGCTTCGVYLEDAFIAMGFAAAKDDCSDRLEGDGDFCVAFLTAPDPMEVSEGNAKVDGPAIVADPPRSDAVMLCDNGLFA